MLQHYENENETLKSKIKNIDEETSMIQLELNNRPTSKQIKV